MAYTKTPLYALVKRKKDDLDVVVDSVANDPRACWRKVGADFATAFRLDGFKAEEIEITTVIRKRRAKAQEARA